MTKESPKFEFPEITPEYIAKLEAALDALPTTEEELRTPQDTSPEDPNMIFLPAYVWNSKH